MNEILEYFDTGLREHIYDDVVWHGSGFIYSDGKIRYPISRGTDMLIETDGSVSVYHNGERCL